MEEEEKYNSKEMNADVQSITKDLLSVQNKLDKIYKKYKKLIKFLDMRIIFLATALDDDLVYFQTAADELIPEENIKNFLQGFKK